MDTIITWRRDVPFLALACFVHGWLIFHAPAFSWLSLNSLSQESRSDPLVQIGFEVLPAPSVGPVATGGASAGKVTLKLRKASVRKVVARPKAVSAKPKLVAQAPKKIKRRLPLQFYTALDKAALAQQLAALPNPDEWVASRGAPAGSIKGTEKFKLPAAPHSGDILDALANQSEAPQADGEDSQQEEAGTGMGGSGSGAVDGWGGGGGPVNWLLEGPAGNRKLLRQILPPCPDWVAGRNLELKVRLKFRVLDDGTIKEVILVRQTSGFPFIDHLSIEALRKWKFQSLPNISGTDGGKKKYPEVWGVVTFRFVSA